MNQPRPTIAALIGVCFLSIFPSCSNYDAAKRFVGIWTNHGDVAALELKDDGTLTLDSKYPDGTTTTVCGRWIAIDHQRIRFDFDTYPNPGQPSVVQSLLVRYCFENGVMIHIPEQGPNKGEAIRLHRINTKNAEQGRKHGAKQQG